MLHLYWGQARGSIIDTVGSGMAAPHLAELFINGRPGLADNEQAGLYKLVLTLHHRHLLELLLSLVY